MLLHTMCMLWESWSTRVFKFGSCHCGPKREPEVLRDAWNLKIAHSLAGIECCRIKAGILGKTWLYKAYGISTVFDDSKDVCEEALEKGLHVFPISTFREDHSWLLNHGGRRPFRTFASAVEAFLFRGGSQP